jgi:hypothetical protein
MRSGTEKYFNLEGHSGWTRRYRAAVLTVSNYWVPNRTFASASLVLSVTGETIGNRN